VPVDAKGRLSSADIAQRVAHARLY